LVQFEQLLSLPDEYVLYKPLKRKEERINICQK
jgi:hypothetical protein